MNTFGESKLTTRKGNILVDKIIDRVENENKDDTILKVPNPFHSNRNF